MPRSAAKFRWKPALFPALYYAANAVYQGYISLYYTDLGFSGGQLGALSTAAAAASLVFQPLWGALSDRSGNRRRVLALLALGAALSFPLKLAGASFPWQIFTAALFYAFFCALLPLSDSLLIAEPGFGGYRLAGGISFAAAGALYGMLGGRMWIVPVLLGFAAAAALLLPEGAGKERGSGMKSLLKMRELMLLLGCMLPAQMSMAYYYTYFAPEFRSIGGSDALLGLGYFICAAAEAPYLLLSGRIYRKWGAARPMMIACGVLALRWALLGWTNSPCIALLSQALHGGGFIVITVSMAKWIGEHVSGEQQSSGQSLLNMVSFGAARILGSALGGVIAGGIGMRAGFYAGAGLCALAGAGLILLARNGNPK